MNRKKIITMRCKHQDIKPTCGNKIAVFGGTFDPPHKGHFQLASKVLEGGYADEVLFIPAYDPPHKPNIPRSPFVDRKEMIELGIEFTNEKRFTINDLESKRKDAPSYTIDTMYELSNIYPKSELLLLIGSDSLMNLHTWYNATELIKTWKTLTYPRQNFENYRDLSLFWSDSIASQLIKGILPFEICEISSTEIRKNIECGKKNTTTLFPNIEKYIEQKGLYK